MRTTHRALAVTILFVLLGGGLAAVTAVGQEEGDGGKKTVFTVGDPQGIDNMNPIIGITLAAFEAWNLQYPFLTNKAAKDFAIIPGLATSWKGSEDGLTWTYKLRPGMKWSDGKPLTAEDVAWTINTSREEEWLNHSTTTTNLKAEAKDATTLIITSKVPDPKLPGLDVYIMPKHVYGPMTADEREKDPGEQGVGGGPFVLEKFEKGQFARFAANPNFYGGKPAVDEVVLRKFNNGDAMVAALKTGEIDAATDLSTSGLNELKQDENIQTVDGFQGSMGDIVINGGDGLKKPHPALLDPKVRTAIAHAIDRETIVSRALEGAGKVQETLSTSPNPKWTPELAPGDIPEFDLEKAKKILDDAGYKDTDGDGVREMPNGGRPLNFVYMVRSDGINARPIAEFFTGWLKEIGIATTRKVADDTQLTTIIGEGDYDIFNWSWTPYVDPDNMLSYMTCDQIADDPDNPTDYTNDANYCDPGYDKLYEQQKVELDDAKRVEIVHEMLKRQAQWGVYNTLFTEPEGQAYRKDRFTGFVAQPAGDGPVIYSNTSPSYPRLKPVSATAAADDGDGGSSSGAIIAIVAAGLLVLGGGAFVLSRRRSADERE